ncbi:hypothetical protein C8A03DRAFT_30077 [Achaetomium macrosporum]|uniref:Uncharacterized protein n=1 Tax=Achaetomium macrosporum TaxID=79813 RepID=A0AAN7HE62_9PEZI|nr:hypothetical protein C8A03DRAFT_30077 [Achaetomium macrosporum]
MAHKSRSLCQRALSDPSSLTATEKNAILYLPPPSEENQLHQSAFGLPSRAALVAKALDDSDGASLTNEEAEWLSRLGFYNPFVKQTVDESFARLGQRNKTPRADLDLVADAQEAVLSQDERLAKRRAQGQLERVSAEKKRAKEEQMAKIREWRSQPRPKWLQELKDAALPRWGFVVLRTAYSDGDEAWERFKEYWRQTGECQLELWLKNGPELWGTHESVFVSDREALEGADTGALRARVRAMREAGEIPEGVRGDVFLVVDQKALSNEQFAQGRRYVPGPDAKGTVHLRAVDPDYDLEEEPVSTEEPDSGFGGEITVPLP